MIKLIDELATYIQKRLFQNKLYFMWESAQRKVDDKTANCAVFGELLEPTEGLLASQCNFSVW